MKPLKISGLYKAFLVFDIGAAVTFHPPTRTSEDNLVSNQMKRVQRLQLTKIDPTNIESTARRIEKRNSIRKMKCGPHFKESRPSQHNNTVPVQYGPAQIQQEKKFQDLVEEVITEKRLGYKINEASVRTNKLSVLYKQTLLFLDEEVLKHLRRQNKLIPCTAIF